MVSLFKRPKVARSQVASLNPLTYEDGVSICEFFTSSSKYFGRQVVPIKNERNDGSRSYMAPIAHFHLLQNEEFYVESGRGVWYMQGKKIHLKTGDSLTIPRCIGHRFENDPDSPEPLVILYQYDPARWDMEERFFRNVFAYFDDCRKQGVEISLLQVCVFCADAWMPADLIPCPGGDYVRVLVNAIFMWVAACMGILCGYRRSYPEYYDPALSRQRLSEGLKKEM